MKITTALNKEGASVTIDVLGEFVESREVALNETEQSIEVLNQISYGNLKAELSVKLTSLGLGIDEEFAYNNLFKVVKRANELGLFVRTDMENSPFTQKTIELQRRIKAVFPDNIGIVLQAYMRRSESDILSLVKDNVNFRLCKGFIMNLKILLLKIEKKFKIII